MNRVPDSACLEDLLDGVAARVRVGRAGRGDQRPFGVHPYATLTLGQATWKSLRLLNLIGVRLGVKMKKWAK